MINRLFKTNQFKRSFKKKRLSDEEELAYIEVAYTLLKSKTLHKKYKDHQLKGNMIDFRECHLKPDLLLIYQVKESTLRLIDLGSHAELFD